MVDVVILTVLPEEYNAVCKKIPDLESPALHSANLHAWKVGRVGSGRACEVAVGMMGRPGSGKAVAAVTDSIETFGPRYVLFVGIAGGFLDLAKGDVIVADTIYGYEYGKLDGSSMFTPRGNWAFRTDLGLLNGALEHAGNCDWKKLIQVRPRRQVSPKVVAGDVASGDKVVDDPTNEFFTQVLQMWPKVKAVEMEGAGVGHAIEYAQAQGKRVGFLMIRGISDLPRSPTSKPRVRGTAERDAWKKYAAETAAAFAISYVSAGLPDSPPRLRLPSADPYVQFFDLERARLTEHYVAWAEGANTIDIVSLSMQVILENYGDERLISWVMGGKKVRVLVLSPRSITARIRGNEERIDLPKKIQTQIKRLRNICKQAQRQMSRDTAERCLGSLEVRVYDGIPYFAYFGTEKEVVVGLYYAHRTGLQSPAILIDARSSAFEQLREHFDVLWRGPDRDEKRCRARVVCTISGTGVYLMDLRSL
jgi:nucleoside phosphorylase